VQKVCSIAAAARAGHIAAVQAPIGHDGFGRDDVACDQRASELFKYRSSVGPCASVRLRHAHSSIAFHRRASVGVRQVALARKLDPRGYPVAHVRFKPTHCPGAQCHSRRKCAISDKLVQRAARQARALLNLRPAKDGGLFQYLGVHVRQLLEVVACEPARVNVFDLLWPCSRITDLLRKVSGRVAPHSACRRRPPIGMALLALHLRRRSPRRYSSATVHPLAVSARVMPVSASPSPLRGRPCRPHLHQAGGLRVGDPCGSSP